MKWQTSCDNHNVLVTFDDSLLFVSLESLIIAHLKGPRWYTHRVLNTVPYLGEVLALPQVIYTWKERTDSTNLTRQFCRSLSIHQRTMVYMWWILTFLSSFYWWKEPKPGECMWEEGPSSGWTSHFSAVRSVNWQLTSLTQKNKVSKEIMELGNARSLGNRPNDKTTRY